KIKYHTMEPPETSVSRYQPDKNKLKEALHQFFQQMNETEHSRPLIEMCQTIIDTYDTWTDMFKALLNEVFKSYGLLMIDANDATLRQLEKPLIKKMIEKHEEVDDAFRNTQAETTANGLEQMIQTDTNVHLFLHEDNKRQLLNFKDGQFHLSKSEKT